MIKVTVNPPPPKAHSKIRSPQAPPDIHAVPFDQKPITVLGIGNTAVKVLHDSGIFLLPDMVAFVESGGDFTEFPGIGPVTAEKIKTLLESYNER